MKPFLSAAITMMVSALSASNTHATTLVVTTEYVAGATRTTNMWIDEDRFRAESPGIVRIFKEGRLYQVDLRERTYSVLDREVLAKFSAEYRTAMDELKASIPSPKRELVDTQRVELGANRSCRVWEVLVDDVLTQQICVVPLSALATARQIRKTMDGYNELLAEFPAVTPDLPWSDVAKTNGLPIITTTYFNGKIHHKSVTTMIKTHPASIDALYELPPDLREVHNF